MKRKKITFVRNKLSPFDIKLAKNLKKRGFEISSITFYELNEKYKKIFDKSLYIIKSNCRELSRFRKILYLSRFIKKLFKDKYNIIIGITSSSNWLVSLIFFLLKSRVEKRVYFPYDISFFRYKNYRKYSWYNRLCEKYNFLYCDGIIHKGPDYELNYLPKDFNAFNKPEIQFLPYCDENAFVKINDDFFKKKLSKKDGEIHLVYVGGVYHNDKFHFNTINVFKEIVNQKLHMHVYSTKYRNIVTDSDYKKLCENKYFHLHKPIYGKKFQKEISKYDWGIIIFFINFEKIKRIWAETAFGNKFSNYLEAGIPIIQNDQEEFSADLVEKYGFGIIINKSNEIFKKIKETDYKEIIENIKKRRNAFTLKTNLVKLISFIEKLN